MEDSICVEEFKCPKCGCCTFGKRLIEMNLFVCDNCKHLVRAYCETCGQHYTFDNFSKVGDKYVCNTCGKVHNGVTVLVQAAAQAYMEKLSPEEKRLLQIKQEAEAFAERMRRERENI